MAFVGYIDLSKKDVNTTESQQAKKKYSRAKKVHSMLQHVMLDEKVGKLTSMKELYEKVVFPLHKSYKRDALRAFLAWYK